jgi:hypothetical protein
MNPEHPPLVKELAALPLLAKDPWPPNLELTTQDLEPVPDYTSTRRAIRHAWASDWPTSIQMDFRTFLTARRFKTVKRPRLESGQRPAARRRLRN